MNMHDSVSRTAGNLSDRVSHYKKVLTDGGILEDEADRVIAMAVAIAFQSAKTEGAERGAVILHIASELGVVISDRWDEFQERKREGGLS